MALLIYQTVAFIPAQTAGVSNFLSRGGPLNLDFNRAVIAQPFPVHDQQYATHLDFEVPSPVFADGWRSPLETRTNPPLAPAEQQYVGQGFGAIASAPHKEGWEG